MKHFTKKCLKKLLMASVLMECISDPTLSLEDFLTDEKIYNKTTACPSNKSGGVGAAPKIIARKLKNISF